MATALGAGRLAWVFASFMNVSLLDQNAHYMPVGFVQDPNNVED